MKTLFIAFFCITSALSAQLKTSVTVDEMEGTKTIRTENVPFKSSGTRIEMGMSYAKGIYAIAVDFYERGSGKGCFSQYEGIMKVKLKNGAVLDFKQFSDTDCGDYGVVLYLPISPENTSDPKYQDLIDENINKLYSNDWELIRIYKTEYYIELKPESFRKNKNPQTFFKDAISSIKSEL